MISFDAWILRKRNEILRTPWLKQDRRLKNSELIFSEQMFSALICLNFLPWSILNLIEKSGKVILAEFNSFPSHVVNKHTGLGNWKTHRLANVAMQGYIQARKY